MKKLIYFLIFLLLISSTYALTFEEGVVLDPSGVSFNYTLTRDITDATQIEVNNTCAIITGGTYAGTNCNDLHLLTLNNIILFPNLDSLKCYINLSHDNNPYTIDYNWLNQSNNIWYSGTTTCEHNTNCTVDTFDGQYAKANDNISCQINLTEEYYTYVNKTSPINASSIGECSASNPYPIINFSYFNESTNTNISVTNGYNLSFYDGVDTVSIQGNFSTNTSHQICTNVDPSDATISLIMYGTMIVSNPDFITRVFNIPQAEGITTSNNPVKQQKLYLIQAADSTTMTYTWQTTTFEYIDGTMLIYRCEDNGSTSLIESITVSGGIATANLNILTTAYSYKLVIGSTTYTDPSFTDCRVESSTTHTFYVDVTELDILPVVGLFLIDCKIENTSTDTVKMTWTANTEDTSDIEACIIAKRQTLRGQQEIFRNCTNASSGSFIRTIPNNGNAYFVMGEITQNNVTGFCRDTVSFFTQSDTSQIVGLNGILAIALLIIAMALFYAGEGELQIGAAVAGVVLSWIIGILSFGWEVVTAIIVFAIIIAVIGRYSKKREIE